MDGQIRESSETRLASSPDILQLSSTPTPPLSHLTHIHNSLNQTQSQSLSTVSLHCGEYLCPKNGPFSSPTRSTPPDPRWVLYLPGALALCPLLTPSLATSLPEYIQDFFKFTIFGESSGEKNRMGHSI